MARIVCHLLKSFGKLPPYRSTFFLGISEGFFGGEGGRTQDLAHVGEKLCFLGPLLLGHSKARVS